MKEVTVRELLDTMPVGGKLVNVLKDTWSIYGMHGACVLNAKSTEALLSFVKSDRLQAAKDRVVAAAVKGGWIHCPSELANAVDALQALGAEHE